jgi:phage antirepressor YoqD-like protein
MNRPYQKYLDCGRFELKILHYTDPHTGKLKTKSMPFLTGKGLFWLHQYIEKHGCDEL